MLPKSQKVLFGARSLIHKKYWVTPALILLLKVRYHRKTSIFCNVGAFFCSLTSMKCISSTFFCTCELKEHKNEYEFRKTFNDVKMVMMIHSETGTKALCVSMFSLLFLRDLGYVTNAIQLQRLNK